MSIIGEKIKTLRKERKLTQKELAHKVGVTASTITKYETGQLEPNLETLNRIADTFNISISNLIADNCSRKEFSLIDDFKDKLSSDEISKEAIDELTECVLIAVITKYNLNVDINSITDEDKKLMFALACSTVKTFIEDLIARKSKND